VAEDQRRRVLAAVPAALARFGYEGAAVASIIEPAGISRRTFYDLFDGKADAFTAAHEEALALLWARAHPACEREREWPRRVVAAVEAVAEWVAANPLRAHLLVVEPLTAGPGVGYCHDALVSRFAPSLRQGKTACRVDLPPSYEEILLGGISGVVASRLAQGKAASLPTIAPQLAEFLLTPYLDGAEARRIARGLA
jgi:AcrR family transcriptional regulator